MPWLRPLPREVAPALLLPLLSVLGFWQSHFRATPIPPEAAYHLRVQTTGADQVRMMVEPARTGLPTSGRQCSDSRCTRSTTMSWDAQNVYVLTRTEQHQEIHLRAQLKSGGLLYSNAVVVPKRPAPPPPPKPEAPPPPAAPKVAEVAPEGSLRLLFADAVTGRPVPGVRYVVTDAKGQRHSDRGALLLHLPVGPAKVAAQALGYVTRTQALVVKAGLEQELRFPLNPTPGPLAARSARPIWPAPRRRLT